MLNFRVGHEENRASCTWGCCELLHTTVLPMKRHFKSGKPPTDKHTLKQPEHPYSYSSAHSEEKWTKITTHICLLRAFLFCLVDNSGEKTGNEKCNSLLLLARIRLAHRHTPLAGSHPLAVYSFSSFCHTWLCAGIISALTRLMLTLWLLTKTILSGLM